MHEVELHFIAFTSGNFFACSAFYRDVDMSFLLLLLLHDNLNFDVKSMLFAVDRIASGNLG